MTNPVSSPQPEGWEERLERAMHEWFDGKPAYMDFVHISSFLRAELDRAKREERQRFYDELNAYGAPKGYTGPLPTTEQLLEIFKDMRPTSPPTKENEV